MDAKRTVTSFTNTCHWVTVTLTPTEAERLRTELARSRDGLAQDQLYDTLCAALASDMSEAE